MATTPMKGPAPRSLLEFATRFPDDRACEEYLFQWRWPEGFRCSRCDGRDATRLSTRAVYQCKGCRRQTTLTAGTAFQDSKLGLRRWFFAIFLVGRHKQGISALQLMNDLAIGCYRSAWLLLQKIRAALDENSKWPLKGLVEIDETLIGAQGKGDLPGKGAGKKAIVVGAVELGDWSETRKAHTWAGVRLGTAPDVTKESLGRFVRDKIAPGTRLLTDGWRAYNHLTKAGYAHESDATSDYTKTELRLANVLPHVHLLFSNLKTWIAGTFKGVSHQYLPRYLGEFSYRVNRRRDASHKLFDWIARRLSRGGPATLEAIRC
jgi:hypothetical protein